MSEYGAKRGEINGWRCEECGAVTYCVHVDDGVTPMFLGCRATEGCNGRASSLMYPGPPHPAPIEEAVAWEWYRPSKRKAKRMGIWDGHVELGGLAIRPLTPRGLRQLPGRVTPIAPPAEGGTLVKPGRNEPCTCASGRKFKRCCGA